MIPPEWQLTGKTALVTIDDRGWAPTLVSALAEAGADVAWQSRRLRRTASERSICPST